MSTSAATLVPKVRAVLIAAVVFLWLNFIAQLAGIGLVASLMATLSAYGYGYNDDDDDYNDDYNDDDDDDDLYGYDDDTSAVMSVFAPLMAVVVLNFLLVVIPAIYASVVTAQFNKQTRSQDDGVPFGRAKVHGIVLIVVAALQIVLGAAVVGLAATTDLEVIGGGVLSFISGGLLIAAGALLVKYANAHCDVLRGLPTHTLPMTGYASGPEAEHTSPPEMEHKYFGSTEGGVASGAHPFPHSQPEPSMHLAPQPGNPLFSYRAQ